ncbi:hypothetical protein JCM10212_004095 [Sporobolomyces blumeae]
MPLARNSPARSRILKIALFFLLATVTLADEAAKNRVITVVNNCDYTVWPAIFTSVGPKPDFKTGWEAKPGTSTGFEVLESTECDFTKDVPDYLQCNTGGCKGGLECDPDAGTGRLPVTLAEFNIQTNIDHYDTSNVDGFNIPMAVTNSADCPLSNCPYDLNESCPDDLQSKNDAGDVVGCLTDCGAHGDNEEYCCSGAHSLPENCPSSAIPNYPWWKKNCPIAYAYAYDESSGTALFTCEKRVDWMVTFCPGPELYASAAILPNGTEITQGEDFPDYPKGTAVDGGGAPSSVDNPDNLGLSDDAGGSSSGGGGGTSGGGGDADSSESTSAGDGATKTEGAASASETGAGSGSTSAGGGTEGAAYATSSPSCPARDCCRVAAETDLTRLTPPNSTGSSSSKTASSGGSSSSPTSSSGGSSSSSSSSEDEILGLPKTTAYIALGCLALVAIALIGFFVLRKSPSSSSRRHSHHSGRKKRSDDGYDDDDDRDSRGGSSADETESGTDSHGDDDDDSSDSSTGKRRSYKALAKLDRIAEAGTTWFDQAARDPARGLSQVAVGSASTGRRGGTRGGRGGGGGGGGDAESARRTSFSLGRGGSTGSSSSEAEEEMRLIDEINARGGSRRVTRAGM